MRQRVVVQTSPPSKHSVNYMVKKKTFKCVFPITFPGHSSGPRDVDKRSCGLEELGQGCLVGYHSYIYIRCRILLIKVSRYSNPGPHHESRDCFHIVLHVNAWLFKKVSAEFIYLYDDVHLC